MASHLYTYPLDMTSTSAGIGNHRITFQQLKTTAANPTAVPGDMVAMYLPPDALKTSYTQAYGDADVGGVMAQSIMGSNASSENLGSALEAGLAGNVGSAVSQLANVGISAPIKDAFSTAIAKEAIEIAGQKFGTAVQALERKVGKIKNHHKAIIYQGPGGFRSFSYSFVMMPRSKDEAEVVNKIVHFFKYYMHPEVTGQNNSSRGTNYTTSSAGPQGETSTSLTLSYPDEFKIRISPRGKDGDAEVGTNSSDGRASQVKPLFRIDRCFLESLNVDYSTSGQAVFFDDGSEPVTTTLQLSFKETVLMTREAIRQGF